jgi:amidohydrolase
MLTREQLRTYIEEILPKIRKLRHELHAIPELAGEEFETHEVLKQQTDTLNPLYWQPKIKTDLVFEIPGGDPGKVVGFRADMDALPLLETSRIPYHSTHSGKMHACGHDGHMSILMGTAMVAHAFRSSLPNTIRFIFQPGEEAACMGAELVEKGVCDGLSAVYGFHNWPGLPVGAVSCKSGIMFAAAHSFKVVFKGIGTHGATPEKGLNPLIPAADTVLRLQNLHTRYNEESGAVISVCAVQGGMNSNVIPSEAVVQGTTRYIDTAIGEAIEASIREEMRKSAETCNVEYSLEYEKKYYIPVVNDSDQTENLRLAVNKVLGDEAYIPAKTHTMGAEDFAFYVNRVSGCMFWLGTGEDCAPIHSNKFDFNDDSIMNGILVLCSLMFGDLLE